MRSPFEVAILVACVLTAVLALVTGGDSPVVINTVYGGGAVLWNWALGLGSIGTLIGMWCKAPTNYLLERVGMIWLATVFMVYTVALVAVYAENKAAALIGLTFALALACMVRAYQITRQLAALRQALK